MNARFPERGFNLVELIAVLTLLGVLAVVVLPRVTLFDAMRNEAWREQAVAGLRLAQSTAVGHRRLVCASFTGTDLRLSMATAYPATSCSQALRGPDGGDVFTGSAPTRGAAVTVNTAGLIYFQPDGSVSRDGAGATVANRTVALTGVTTITVYGRSGHVE